MCRIIAKLSLKRSFLMTRNYCTREKPSSNYDVIIVGGEDRTSSNQFFINKTSTCDSEGFRCHNGLIAAAYLAKKGVKTCVLERRPCLGGAAVTEEIIPGFRFSRASYLLSLLRPQIYQDLQLKKYGLEYFVRNPSSYTPLKKSTWTSKARSLTLGSDQRFNHAEISKFSKKDAENYIKYEKKLQEFLECIEPLMDVSPHMISDLCSDEKSILTKMKILSLSPSARQMMRGIFKLRSCLPFAYDVMFSPAVDIMNKWFEAEPLKATILTDACIGSFQSPTSIGSSYILLHHVMGGIEQHRGAWVYPKGGMGSLSDAIAKCALNHGAHLFTNQQVMEIRLNNDGGVAGVQTADGHVLRSRFVLSNATPKITFLDLLPEQALDDNFKSSVRNINYDSPVTKINVALKRIPNFESDPNSDTIMPHHRCTIHLNCESIDDILCAHREGAAGSLPHRPMIELTIPSSLDPTLCPSGNHVCLMFTQYTKYTLNNGSSWDFETRTKYANQVFDCVEEYAPGFKESVIGYEVLPPPELERIFGLTGGHIFHGELTLDRLLFSRPTNRYNALSPYTPIEGLFLCGSGAHPGGGVTGSPGRLCALEVIAKLKRMK